MTLTNDIIISDNNHGDNHSEVQHVLKEEHTNLMRIESQNNNLSIPHPCPMHWGKMKKVKGGRMCDSCNKKVHDFRRSSHKEIIEALKKNGEEMCITVNANQLTGQTQILHTLSYRFKFFLLTLIAFIGISVKPLYAQGGAILKDSTARKKEHVDRSENIEEGKQDEKSEKKLKRGIWPFRKKRRIFRGKYIGCPRFL